MKNMIFLFIGVFLLVSSNTSYCSNSDGKKTVARANRTIERSLPVLSTPELYPLLETWASEYSKLNPEVNIEVIQLKDSQIAVGLNKRADLAFISNENRDLLDDDATWKMVVGRRAIVPVISSRNPFQDKLNQHGVSSDKLAQLVSHHGKQTWGTLLSNGQTAPVHYYFIKDESIRSHVADFLGTDPALIDGISVGSGEEMISAIQKDPYGIGFCSMTDVLDFENQRLVEDIKFLPIDKNKNGNLDYFENIYTDLNKFTRGVWIGKYPKALIRTIYSVASEKPSNKTEVAFLTWVLTGGQQFINPVAYSDLAYSDRQSKRVAMLTNSPVRVNQLAKTGLFGSNLSGLSLFSIIVICLIPIILAFMIRDAVLRHKRLKRAAVPDAISISPVVFDENSVDIPAGLFFDKSHTWAFMEKNGIVRIGIDDFLQHITGTLTRIKMKNPGEMVKKGEQLLSIIQNGKQLTIHAPISGTIRAQNRTLISNTSVMNSSPYTDGWVYMIEPTNWAREIRFLFMGEKYKEWLRKEFSRLKDFLAHSIKGNEFEHVHIILQDGGELKDGILAELGPNVWEDFQTHFIDTSK